MGKQIRNIKILGIGSEKGHKELEFSGQFRYRLKEGETLLDLAETAARKALNKSNLTINDIDLIVCGMATPLQAIPCNATLIHERLAKGLDIPAMDINTTCTSFISAIDVVSYMIEADRYKNVLLLSGDTASAALNPNQKESFELFSDAATACVLTKSIDDSKILYSKQVTYSEGAHDTEIRGGCGLMPSFDMTEKNKEDYYFDMKGIKILRLCAKKLPDLINTCFSEAGLNKEDIDMIVPHQASAALKVIMKKLGFKEGTYIDNVHKYGNMVSSSVPFAFCEAIEDGVIKRRDTIVLMGTAAGLTINFMILKY